MSSRYEERRKDRQAAAAIKRRNKAAADDRRAARAHEALLLQEEKARLRREERQRTDKDKAKRRKDRQERARRVYRAVTARVPLPVLVVVAVSMAMAWAGQVEAAAMLGLGLASLGVPFITEGLTFAFAQQAEAAVRDGRPALRWRVLTAVSGLAAAALNYYGHATLPASVVDDATDERRSALQQEADVRAVIYAVASLSGLVAWEASLWAKAAKRKGTTTAQKRRARARRLRYPRVSWRASQLRVIDPRLDVDTAFALAWERRTGAPFGQPSRREILRQRRAMRLRAEAEQWDGTRGWFVVRRRRPPPAALPVPGGVPPLLLGPASVVPQAVPGPQHSSSSTAFQGPQGALEFKFPAGETPGGNSTAQRAGNGVQVPAGTGSGNSSSRSGNTSGGRPRNPFRGRSEADWQRLVDQARGAAPRLIEEAYRDARKRGRDGSLLSPYRLASAIGMRRSGGPELLHRLEQQHGEELAQIIRQLDTDAAEPARAASGNTDRSPEPGPGAGTQSHPPVNGDGDRRPEPVTSR